MPNSKLIAQLDLNLLKVFEIIYQQRSMTLAAQLLHISPSAVSHAMRRLRLALEDELFIRKGHTLQPTPLCHRLASELLATLNHLRDVLQHCGQFDLSTSTQTFTVSVHDSIEPLIAPALLAAVQKDAPMCKLNLIRMTRADLPMRLGSGEWDAAIDVALPLRAPICHQHLSEDQFCLMVGKHNAIGDTLSASAYLAAQHLTVSNRASGTVLEDISLLQQGINRQISVRCQSYHSAVALLKSSNMLLTLPTMIAQHLLDSELRLLPCPVTIPAVMTQLYWHQQSDQDPGSQWLRKQIQQVFNQP